MAVVTIYSKPGCHLCDIAVDVLDRVRQDIPFAVEKVNIENDEQLLERYRTSIPVVHVNGRPAFKYKVNEARLRDLLREDKQT